MEHTKLVGALLLMIVVIIYIAFADFSVLKKGKDKNMLPENIPAKTSSPNATVAIEK